LSPSTFTLSEPPTAPVLIDVFEPLDPPVKVILSDDPLLLPSLELTEPDFESVVVVFLLLDSI
jgi:hypothetical protein